MNPAEGSPPLIEVLLATYNGAAFLEHQIDSILEQSYGTWRVLARDDGSEDGTVEILRGYAARHPGRFVLIEDGAGNQGYRGNFSMLLERSTADYVALCDQDDEWYPNKLALCMQEMRAMEEIHGPVSPLLVFTDLEVVDEELEPIAGSLWDYAGLDPDISQRFSMLLIQNVVTGCTTLINRPLVVLSSPIPEAAAAHDWWIALTAAAHGHAAYLRTGTVRYRQHGSNMIGAMALRGAVPLNLFAFARTFRHDFRCKLDQAAAFAKRFAEQFSPEQADLVRELLRLPGLTAPRRLHLLLMGRYLRPHRRFHKRLFVMLAYMLLTSGPAYEWQSSQVQRTGTTARIRGRRAHENLGPSN